MRHRFHRLVSATWTLIMEEEDITETSSTLTGLMVRDCSTHTHRERKSVVLLEGTQASPARLSDNNTGKHITSSLQRPTGQECLRGQSPFVVRPTRNTWTQSFSMLKQVIHIGRVGFKWLNIRIIQTLHRILAMRRYYEQFKIYTPMKNIHFKFSFSNRVNGAVYATIISTNQDKIRGRY
jgi:hypothetical protein